ncbi:MAG: hypothetical protein ACREFX_10160 [Opitutaceae bacterium]
METLQRKARLFFETKARPASVTFDDGKDWRRNMPWLRYAGSNWSYPEPDMLRIEIDEWIVMLSGHNLGPLFAAIEEQTLASVRAHPEWGDARDRELDSFVTAIRFAPASAFAPQVKRKAPRQLGLGRE